MSCTDPIADMLTRIRNGQNARLYVVNSPFSQIRSEVLEVLKVEGYIDQYSVEEENGRKSLKINLKYHNGAPVISIIKRVSRPGRRTYSKIRDMKKFYNGLGIYILSTPKGVMSDHRAGTENVGGEVLCAVF